MLQIKLSDAKYCLDCPTNKDTVFVKNNAQDFQGILCPAHLIARMKKWEKEEASVETNSQ